MRLDLHDDLISAPLRAELATLADVLLWQFGHKSNPDDPAAFIWFPLGRTREQIAQYAPVAALFDARIPHAGRAPGRWCPRMRVSIAFKLRPKGAPRIAKLG